MVAEEPARPLQITLQERQIGTDGLDFVAIKLRARRLQRGLIHRQRRFGLAQPRFEIVPVQLANHLAGVHDIAHVHRQPQDDAAGFGFDFDLRRRLDLARRHNRPGQIHALDARQFFRVDLRSAAADRLQ